MAHKHITVQGARVNNLKNISIDIPRNQFIVITGLSGSGKSSLAFDTLYAEGQRRYVESLSSYARQFMGKLSKPDVDAIKGIPPAIAIEQKVLSKNARSTVGTSTEIYEYLKLLFAHCGKTYSPISRKEVKKHDLEDVLQFIENQDDGSKIYILSPLQIVSGRTPLQQLEILKQQGFSRVMMNGELVMIDDLLTEKRINKSAEILILIDRVKAERAAESRLRLADSVQTAFYEGKGKCVVMVELGGEVKREAFSDRFELDGIVFEKPTVHLFSFNNPFGSCPNCNGAGVIHGPDPNKVIPDKTLSVFEGAVKPWATKYPVWQNDFIKAAGACGFPIHRPVKELTEAEFDLLWNGSPEHGVEGIMQFVDTELTRRVFGGFYVTNYEYHGTNRCPVCKGSRLRREANWVKVHGKTMRDLVEMPIEKLYTFFKNFEFEDAREQVIAELIIKELVNRIGFLYDVGLGYLTLNRESKSLSGGESQRINIAKSLGSSLVGSLYILDEPSIGLHLRDTQSLIRVLQRLRDIGNTVIVVEHDEEIIRSADYVIDIGPRAGRLGGEVVFKGTVAQLLQEKENLTAAYLRGIDDPNGDDVLTIPMPQKRRKWRNYVEIVGANENNLQNITVKIPLEVMTVVTGVSGSGKSSLIKGILAPAVQSKLGNQITELGAFKSINGDFGKIQEVVMVDQDPIGRSTRSNPATYVKAFDLIRELFAAQPLARQRFYKSQYFSFNTQGGRCEECHGEGVIHVSMQFMADVNLVCEECGGKRYKEDVLDVKVGGSNISDILDMTVNQAVEFFIKLPQKSDIVKEIVALLLPLQEVGLGYLKLGQPTSTLSGGEAQRLKLAYYLTQDDSKQNILFIFDEPTTGLHFHDINKLNQAFNRLIERGNSIVIIEHNPEIIKCADWIIDLGPGGGEHGGKVVFEGTPENLVKSAKSITGQIIKLR